MEAGDHIFERFEIKYLLKEEQYHELRGRLASYLVEDEYGETDICNCYYDTPDYRLIRNSLEGAVYKEKLRLRSYGIPEDGKAQVFLELKKKYQGVVYKRREILTHEEADAYLNDRRRPKQDSQILREIDWVLHYYGKLIPAMYLSYKRLAMIENRELGKIESCGLRLTFDWNICWRVENVALQKGMYGKELLGQGKYIMEVKIPNAMPVWLTEIFDEMQLYPLHYSKYGRAYIQFQNQPVSQ